MATFIVHAETGTVMDASDGVLMVDLVDARHLSDEDITFYALRHGRPVLVACEGQ